MPRRNRNVNPASHRPKKAKQVVKFTNGGRHTNGRSFRVELEDRLPELEAIKAMLEGKK
jgi:hypothetical protein